jgi:hypothetical protein
MTNASYLEGELCNCSICTSNNTRCGAFQSRPTCALHQKVDGAQQNLQQLTLLAVLDNQECDCNIENPLWHGRCTLPTIDVAPEKTVPDGNSEMLVALFNGVQAHKSQYSLSPALHFVHLPATLTDVGISFPLGLY